MDFGLARTPKGLDAQATQTGMIIGTPAYMAPEQARGDSKAVGPQADVFALGVILYEMLAGRRPFRGSPTEVIGQILHVNPEPPSKVNASADPRLETICLKAIAKHPAARFASMKDFAAAVDGWLRGSVSPPTDTARGIETRGDADETGVTDTRRLADVFAELTAEAPSANRGSGRGGRRPAPDAVLGLRDARGAGPGPRCRAGRHRRPGLLHAHAPVRMAVKLPDVTSRTRA